MFYENLAVSIKVNGRFIKENKSEFNIPFGSEYVIYIKNQDSRDALIKNINIDGKNVLGNTQLIVKSNSFIELEGFVEYGNITNKFKFVEVSKVDSISAETSPENGQIRIEFCFTKKKETKIVEEITNHKDYYYPIYEPWYYPYYPKRTSPWISPFIYSNNNGYDSSNSENISFINAYNCNSNNSKSFSSTINSFSCSDGKKVSSFRNYSDSNGRGYVTSYEKILDELSKPNEDEGKTIKGNKSNQSLVDAYIGEVDYLNSHIILIKLKGIKIETSKKEISDLNEGDKDYLYCPECGIKLTNTYYHYCPKCGTKII